MNELTLFHGSPVIVEAPKYGYGKTTNDYGQGFYCTENEELAKEWACPDGKNGFCNEYRLPVSELSIVYLNGAGWNILNWLALLQENRRVRFRTAIEKQAVVYITSHYASDLSGADIIIGYRADDRYFAFVRDFLSNQITIEQLSAAMYLGELGEQVFLQSRKAFDSIRFVGAEPVDGGSYYPRRMGRARKADDQYQKILEQPSGEGIYVADVLRGIVTSDQLENAAERVTRHECVQ